MGYVTDAYTQTKVGGREVVCVTGVYQEVCVTKVGGGMAD